MAENNMDKQLNEALINVNAKNKLIKEDGTIDVPGTPLILPGRGIRPKADEYLDSSLDSGVTKDTNKIEQLKIKNQRDIIENALLGRFDDHGIYSVADEISKELIEMVKVITTMDNLDDDEKNFLDTEHGKVKMLPSVIYVETLSEFGGVGKFNFAIQTYYEGLQSSSELFLLEDIKKADGFSQNINIYSVGKYTEAFGPDYKKNMFRYFNIVSKELASKMSDEEKVLFGWAYRRKIYLKTLSAFGNSKYQLAEASYLNAKIEALSNLGAYGATVISMFNDLQERAKLILGKDLTARDLNDLLDIILDDMTSKYPEMTKIYHSAIHGATLEYAQEIKTITEANVPAAQAKTKELSRKDDLSWTLKGKANKNIYLKPAKKKKENKKEEKKEKAKSASKPSASISKSKTNIAELVKEEKNNENRINLQSKNDEYTQRKERKQGLETKNEDKKLDLGHSIPKSEGLESKQKEERKSDLDSSLQNPKKLKLEKEEKKSNLGSSIKKDKELEI